MHRAKIAVAALVLMISAGPAGSTNVLAADQPKGPERWESNIAKFEQLDKEDPPAEGGILFIGSSSIVRWDLAKWFPGLPVVNRGFGGSQVADSVFYAERIIGCHRPRLIVFYAGDNDLAAGKSAETVLADTRAFVAKIHEQLPKTKIVYVAIKPSIKRWNLIDAVREANRLIRAETGKDARLEFVDVDRPMIGADGMPRKELFVADGLHLSDEGYRLWTDLLLPYLKP